MKKTAFFVLLFFCSMESTVRADNSSSTSAESQQAPESSNSLETPLFLATPHNQKPIVPTGINRFFNYLGDKTDQWVTDGNVSPKHQQAFEEVTRAMGMEDWGIQIKKSGTIQKKLAGAFNAMAYPFTNRVYIGDALLKYTTNEELRFILAHELAHYRNHHAWKRILLFQPCYYLCRLLLKNLKTLCEKNLDQTNCSWEKAGATALGAYASFLLFLYTSRKFETEADTDAVTIAGIDPEHGITFFADFKQQLRTFFSDLHHQHPSPHERIQHLRNLKKLRTESKTPKAQA